MEYLTDHSRVAGLQYVIRTDSIILYMLLHLNINCASYPMIPE